MEKIICNKCGKEIKGRYNLDILNTNQNTNKSHYFKSECNPPCLSKNNTKEDGFPPITKVMGIQPTFL